MCLILVAHQTTEQIPLLVLANRDEFYSRPTAAADRWDTSPEVIAGRDLVSGGTWFGASGDRWASVTNIREGVRETDNPSSKSRGWLVRDFLQGDSHPEEFLSEIQSKAEDFAGFNLLLGAAGELWYTSNREAPTRRLSPGIYGLSNHLLDTPWPKVVRGTAELQRLLSLPSVDQSEAFSILADTTQASDEELPDTGIPLDWERALSATFIAMPKYGTRCSTILMSSADGQHFLTERRFTGEPQRWEENQFSWSTGGSLLDR